MKALLQILPGEHIASTVARYYYLGDHTTYLKASKDLGLKFGPLSPARFFDTNFSKMSKFYPDPELVLKENFFNNLLESFLKNTRGLSLNSKVPKKREVNFGGHYAINQNSWRWCKKCVTDDSERFGIPYFHRDHQVPGAYKCTKHQINLSSYFCCRPSNDLRSLCIPPEEDICEFCEITLDNHTEYFNEKMDSIQTAMVGLCTKGTDISLETIVKHIRSYLQISAGHKSNTCIRSGLLWNLVNEKFSNENIDYYFKGIGKKTTLETCKTLFMDNRLIAINKSIQPLHPLIYIIALYATNFDLSKL